MWEAFLCKWKFKNAKNLETFFHIPLNFGKICPSLRFSETQISLYGLSDEIKNKGQI